MKIFGIQLAAVHYAWVAAVIIPLIALAIWGWYKRKQIVRQIVSEKWHDHLLRGYSPIKELFRTVLIVVGLLSLLIVFLQPQWGKKEEVVSQSGRDVLFALDISRSMLAQDSEPSRLAVAKKAIKQLVSRLNSERVGLLLFAGSTVVQCPLTTDHHAFISFLDQVDSDTVSSSGTSLAQALMRAIALFKDQPVKKSKIVVAVTDGEDFSEDLSGVKTDAQKNGIALITLGVGSSQGAPIPLIDPEGNLQGYQKDENNAVVFSKLDEALLRNIAESIGGLYLSFGNGYSAQRVIDFINQFEKNLYDDVAMIGLQERYHYFAAISLTALLLAWII